MLKLLNTFFLALPLVLGVAHGQSFNAEQAASTLARYRSQLEALEQEVGRYDPQLLEYLERLAELTIELDQFNETDQILDRAIQILRIDEGLFTEAQFPFLILSARNNVRRGNWRDANESLSHLAELYTIVPRQQDSRLINELLQVSNLHLEGVARDVEQMKDPHFRSAEAISNFAVRVSENTWEATDLRLVDLYYRQVIRNYLQFVVLNQGGPASQGLRRFIPGLDMMIRSRLEMEQLYYRLGVEMFRRMRSVYESAEYPDLEALAMVDLYQADWQVLFDNGDPDGGYRNAYDKLLKAGVVETKLQEYFRKPRVIPSRNFYSSIDRAHESALAEASVTLGHEEREDTLYFVEWSPSVPNIHVVINQPALLQQDISTLNTVRLAIELDGVNKVRRWVRGRYISQVSVIDGFEWLGGTGRRQLTEQQLAERLHYVNFRPVLDAGVPQPFEGILEYRYFPPDRE
jgi:hypothetical protein